jgi:hypothetical protein
MITNYQFERNARRNRTKALFFTVAFHALLLGGILYSGNVEWRDYVPDVVLETIGMDQPEEAVANLPEDAKEVVRP